TRKGAPADAATHPAHIQNDRFGDYSPKACHPLAQPIAYVATVKRKIGAAGAARHQVALTYAGVSHAPNRGNSSDGDAAASGKLDIATPTSRMPCVGGNIV